MELALHFFDWKIIDAGFSALHQTLVVEFPEFVSVSSKPLVFRSVVLVLETDGDLIAGKTPE